MFCCALSRFVALAIDSNYFCIKINAWAKFFKTAPENLKFANKREELIKVGVVNYDVGRWNEWIKGGEKVYNDIWI